MYTYNIYIYSTIFQNLAGISQTPLTLNTFRDWFAKEQKLLSWGEVVSWEHLVVSIELEVVSWEAECYQLRSVEFLALWVVGLFWWVIEWWTSDVAKYEAVIWLDYGMLSEELWDSGSTLLAMASSCEALWDHDGLLLIELEISGTNVRDLKNPDEWTMRLKDRGWSEKEDASGMLAKRVLSCSSWIVKSPGLVSEMWKRLSNTETSPVAKALVGPRNGQLVGSKGWMSNY